MRLILAIVAAAALGWTGWWFFVAQAKERAIAAWLDERRAAGWVAEARAIDVGGFPYRIDTTVRGLELANPPAGWAWTAPEFQFVTLAYQPNHLIAIWPREQTLATPLGATAVASDALRGSLVLDPLAGLALRRSAIEILGLVLAGPGDWEIGLDSAVLATRQAEGEGAAPFAHEIALTAEGLAPPEAWVRGLGRARLLAPVIETAAFDARATFDGPWNRAAIETEPPGLLALDIRDLRLAWGRLDLRGRGRLAADAHGFAEGRIDLRARHWRAMIDVAEEGGALAPGVAGALRGGLGLIARLSGDRDTLEVPLDFGGGVVRLGPIVLGEAPRMVAPGR